VLVLRNIVAKPKIVTVTREPARQPSGVWRLRTAPGESKRDKRSVQSGRALFYAGNLTISSSSLIETSRSKSRPRSESDGNEVHYVDVIEECGLEHSCEAESRSKRKSSEVPSRGTFGSSIMLPFIDVVL